MGKGTRGKSSASAATRKKQAAKAAAKHGTTETPPPVKSGKKMSKKERQQLKKKSYVPPAKPPQPPPNPLDSMGLASMLPPDLVMLLRKALKKDIVTRTRTLESLLAWVQGRAQEGQEELSAEERSSAMLIMLPSWVHLFPRLALSPSQRLRLLTLQVHEQLLRDRDVREELLGAHNVEPILGFWAVLVHDTSRPVARLAQRLWADAVSWEGAADPPQVALSDYTSTLLEHLRPILLSDSASTALAFSTASLQASAPPNEAAVPLEHAKNRDDANVDESADELDARLVAGGLGALLSYITQAPHVAEEELEAFAESGTLWTALQTQGEDVPLLGKESPVVRQRAWSLLGLLHARVPGLVSEHLGVLLPHAFRGAWAERDAAVLTEMLGALLPVLKNHPEAWEGDENDDDPEDEEEEAEEAEDEESHDPSGQDASSLADFLRWVQLAGVQVPRIVFPAVLVFLSTVPTSVLPHTTDAAASILHPLIALAHVLVESAGSIDPLGWDAYALMVCECIAFMVMRLARDADERGNVPALTTEMLTAVWDELVVGRGTSSRIPGRFCVKLAREWGRCLAKVETDVEGTPLLRDTLAHLERDLGAELGTEPDVDAEAAAAVALEAALDAARAHSPPQDALAARVLGLGGLLLRRLSQAAAHTPRVLPVLSNVLLSPLGAAHAQAEGELHAVATTHAAQGASPVDAAAFYEAYLAVRGASVDAQEVWRALLEQSMPPHFTSLALLVRVAQQPPPDSEVLRTWQTRVAAHLSAHDVPRDTCFALLRAPPALLGRDTEAAVLAAAAAHVQASADAACIAALGTWHAHAPEERTRHFCALPSLQRALPAVYAAAHLHNDPHAQNLWASVAPAVPDADAHAVQALRTALLESSAPRASVFGAARTLASDEEPILRVLPDKSQLDAALLLAAVPPNPMLHIVDPLVPLGEAGDADWHSLASVVQVYLAALETDAALAAPLAFALPHLMCAAIGLEDALALQDLNTAATLAHTDEEVWEAARMQLVRLVHAVTRMLSSLCASLPDAWHTDAASAVCSAQPFDALTTLLSEMWAHSASSAAYARILARMLAGVFSLSSASVSDATPWIRAAGAKAPHGVRAALLYATRFAAESSAHDRARNELGATLGGLPPARAASEGVATLQLLACAAPLADTGVPLIPTQRAVYAMQAVQRWLAADEELPDALFVLLPEVCAELAPILQSVAGRIDLLVDLVEENLAAADTAEPLGWSTLHATLHLLHTLGQLHGAELVSEALTAHKTSLAHALHDVFVRLCTECARATVVNEMQTRCLDTLAACVAQYVPFAAFAKDSALRTLLESATPAHGLRVAAFELYAANTRAAVREQVVELAVAPDQKPSSLDAQLLHSLSRRAPITGDVWDAPEAFGDVFAHLVQWLAVLEHFTEASLALKSVYVQALGQHALLGTQLLPSVFVLLGGAPRADPPIRPLDLGRYAVDDIELRALEPTHALSLQVLAAHVYFRTLVHLPTQVRDWFLSVRDRQLSLQVSHITTRFCTPLLAERELSHLRDPDALARLQDEAMAIKILSSNEVVATYTVDEHPMEISVRLPSDFPLHGVEIRDLKRVGVSEGQWRAWLLAVQQMLTGKNGLILDALMLFKKNAEAKFQGYEGAECAICYSIISPTDQTLPNKPCRTCKHKFHGSCLYKWVSTSGASTCPLCRSIL